MPSKSYLWVAAFWKGAVERCCRAFAAAMLAVLGVPQVTGAVGVDVRHVGWLDAAAVGVGAAVVSLLFSIAAGSSGIGPTGSPSLVNDRPSAQDLAAAQRLEREDRAARHRDDGIDVALDNPKEPS